MGCLKDILSDGSRIDIGILINATVEESWLHRRRSHRVVILNNVEDEIEKSRRNRVDEEDVSLRLNGKGQGKKVFSSKETWEFIREKHQLCHWYNAVWFKYSTPKFSFILWTALKGRLATGDRMRHWNGNPNVACVLCNESLETLEHLFFECEFSAQVWEVLMKDILMDKYTVRWEEMLGIMRDLTRDKMQIFLIKYMFQATVYMIWRERNRRRHGETGAPAALLIKILDKNMRNKLTLVLRKGDSQIGRGMQYWFMTR
ncbi:uncharacterized protein LOC125608640 [Brassica napus]|uniref:uncharacterized protein LOC125608640 n=1 Tax=Brassica napus TaxID=3708 RepID=UPI002078DFE1|nr:uncharacterized protein LOC125608640 [Brassica napus]